jgi:hypothetical protein
MVGLATETAHPAAAARLTSHPALLLPQLLLLLLVVGPAHVAATESTPAADADAADMKIS